MQVGIFFSMEVCICLSTLSLQSSGVNLLDRCYVGKDEEGEDEEGVELHLRRPGATRKDLNRDRSHRLERFGTRHMFHLLVY